MQNKWLGRLRAAFMGAMLAMIALYPQDAMAAARSACSIWAGSVMPALFPYMVISQLLLSGTRGGLFTVPLALLGGSPAGARLIQLSGAPPQRAQQLAALCTTASPLFILGTLGGDARLLLAHWLGAGAAWLFARLLQRRTGMTRAHFAASQDPSRVSIPEAVQGASLAMLNVCGCMALFLVLSAMLSKLLPLSPGASIALSCALEMAGGCARIQALGLPTIQAAPLLCGVVSFGGLSVFMQNAGFLRQAGVDLRMQFFSRIVHALAAYVLCGLLYAL